MAKFLNILDAGPAKLMPSIRHQGPHIKSCDLGTTKQGRLSWSYL